MNSRLFWRAALIQAVLVAALFGILVALPLPDDFFEDFGIVAGPIAWIVCALITGRILSLPLPLTALAAAAGGVAGTLVGLVGSHFVAFPVAVAVFAAASAGYEGESAEHT